MDGRNEFRVGLFPSGPCVTDESIEAPGYENYTTDQLFAEIDSGGADERMLVLAKRACETCVQFKSGHCVEQAEEIATELWRKGVGVQFIGGKAISLEKTERPLDDEQPAFTWDLTAIPKEPTAALDILRQGLRAGQFTLRGSFTGIAQTRDKYLEHLAAQDPELHKQILQLGPEDQEQGFKSVLVPLFQQKDFASFSRGKRGTQPEGGRYHPRYFDNEADSEIVNLYFREVLRIKDLDLSRPAQKAAYFTSDFYTRLVDRKPSSLAFKAFDKLITDAPRMPLAAIEKYEQSQDEALRQDAPSTYVKSAALARHHGDYNAKVTALYDEYPGMPQQIVRQVCAKHPTNPDNVLAGVAKRLEAEATVYGDGGAPIKEAERALLVTRYAKSEDYLAALEKFSKNIAELTERFGKGSELTPREIRNFSLVNLNDAVGAALAFKGRLERLRASSDGSVSETTLRKAAQAAREVTFEEVRKKYIHTLIRDRYALRAKREGLKKLTPEVIERITCLCPSPLVDRAAESVYTLTNAGSLLTATADLVGLGGKAHEDLDKIFSPKSQEYITFPAVLRELTPVQRLGFALYHGLTPLLYGRDVNHLQFEQAILSHASLATFYDTDIAPRVAELCGDNQDHTPLSLMELSDDLAVFDKLLKTGGDHPLPQGDDRITLAGLRETTLVVGGKALYVHEKGYDWTWSDTTVDFTDWLTQKVAGSYPPHQQEQAYTYVKDAITAGAIELIGDNPGEFRLVFSRTFYDEHVTEIDRAAVANAMGIDRILYGSDLTNAIRYRLGNTHHVVQISRARTPAVVEFEEADLAAAKKELELEAINFSEQPPLKQILITTLGNNYDFDKITDAQWQKIGDNLLSAYSRYLEHPNHQHEVQDEQTRAEVALAWAHARGGDIYAQARLFSIASEDLAEYIDNGTQLILEQFSNISHVQLKDTLAVLNKVAYLEPAPTSPSQPEEQIADTPVPAIATSPSPITQSIRPSRPEPADKPAEQVVALRQRKEAVVTEKAGPSPSVTQEPPAQVTRIRLRDDTVVDGIRSAKRRPLLKADQEVELAKAIEAGVFAQEKLDNNTYDKADMADLRTIARIGEQALNTMFESNIRLVLSIANRYETTITNERQDMIQDGSMGLLRAIEKFDYAKGYKFSTYATRWIKQAIRRNRADTDRTVRIPVNVIDDQRKILKARAQFEQADKPNPTTAEIAAVTKIPESRIAAAQQGWATQPASLDKLIAVDESDSTFGDFIYDSTADTSGEALDNVAMNQELIGQILEANLTGDYKSELSAAVLILRTGLPLNPTFISPEIVQKYGIQEGTTYTLAEIAKMLDISSGSNVGQYENRALIKLRRPSVLGQIVAAATNYEYEK